MKTTAQPKARMGRLQLSPGQLGALWPMLDAAWRQHCADHGIDAPSSAAKEVWRHEQLEEAVGLRSLKQMRRSGVQFPKFMAHLEVIARNGIQWQMRVHGAEVRPLVFAIQDLVEQWQLDENYVCGIARQALRMETLPRLDTLQPAQLLTLLQILRGKAAELQRRAA